jgi:L-ribulose-5-phosphate 3-epimerase
MSMRLTTHQIGLCSWSLRPEGIDQLIKLMGRAGISRVQLALEPVRRDPARWADAGPKLQQAGIRVISGMFAPVGEDYSTPQTIRDTGGVVPDPTWDENWHNFQRCAILAKGLGVCGISLHAGFIPKDVSGEPFDSLVDRIRRFADLLNDLLNGTLLLETGQEDADLLWAFLNTVDRANVGVKFDPANMLLYDTGDPVKAVRKLMPRVRQVHIKDARRPGTPGQWGEEVPVGAGEVDWQGFLQQLDDADFTGDLVIEREAGERRIDDVKSALAYIGSVIGKDGCGTRPGV